MPWMLFKGKIIPVVDDEPWENEDEVTIEVNKEMVWMPPAVEPMLVVEPELLETLVGFAEEVVAMPEVVCRIPGVVVEKVTSEPIFTDDDDAA